MAMTFGKNNRSIAFDPTSAFPLDARSYFESLESAQAAAAAAGEVGSTNTVYYYGQVISVIENNLATLYIIQTDNSLAPVSFKETDEQVVFEIDPKQFVFDENNALSIKGFNSENVNQILTIGEDGTLCWINPIDTYTKNEIDSKIAAANYLKRKIVKNIEEIKNYMTDHLDADQYIFMIPSGFQAEDNKYEEYLVINHYDNEGILITQSVEQVGTWEVNLEDYAKLTDLDGYVKNETGKRLMTTAEGEKLGAIPINAERNIINDVSEDFTIQDRVLNLNKLRQDKIVGLEEALAKKVDKEKDASLLLTPTDREILDTLNLNGGNVESSTRIPVGNVQGLAQWITGRAGVLKGLSENNYSDSDKQTLAELTKLAYITGVNQDEFLIDDKGILNILKISTKQVDGLESLLDQKANNSTVVSLRTALDSHVESFSKKIDDLDDRLTWQELT